MLTAWKPTVKPIHVIDPMPLLSYHTTGMNQDKLREIKTHTSYKGRMISTLVDAIEGGVDPMDAATLFRLVQEAYNDEETGKHRKPSYVKHRFQRQYSWLLSQIMA